MRRRPGVDPSSSARASGARGRKRTASSADRTTPADAQGVTTEAHALEAVVVLMVDPAQESLPIQSMPQPIGSQSEPRVTRLRVRNAAQAALASVASASSTAPTGTGIAIDSMPLDAHLSARARDGSLALASVARTEQPVAPVPSPPEVGVAVSSISRSDVTTLLVRPVPAHFGERPALLGATQQPTQAAVQSIPTRLRADARTHALVSPVPLHRVLLRRPGTYSPDAIAQSVARCITEYRPAGRARTNPCFNIYNLALHPDAVQLAAGGSDGHISLFRLCPFGGDVVQVLSSRAHERWVSHVQWSTQAGDLLLSSADDGVLSGWLVDRARPTMRRVLYTRELHDGFGLYGFHELRGDIASGGKDYAVRVARLTDAGVRLVHTYSGYHHNVVKRVHWRACGRLLLSAGTDRLAHLYDVRSERAATVFAGLHSGAMNTVLWDPVHPHRFLTSSYDTTIKIVDMRRPDAPLLCLDQHTQVARSFNIIHPLFAFGGTAVAALGEKTDKMTLYRSADGAVLSQHPVGAGFNTLAQHPCTQLFVLSRRDQVHLFAPGMRPAPVDPPAAVR